MIGEGTQQTSSMARDKEAPTMPEVLKVSADSKPKSVAGALAAVLREKGAVELQAVGAGAVNQAVKAIAITRGFVAPNGIDLVAIPAFTKVEIDGEERTAIKFLVEAR
jgi:stage V sporulation protein S